MFASSALTFTVSGLFSGMIEDKVRKSAAKKVSVTKLVSLWKRALELNKAMLLEEIELGPDALLEKVGAFEDTAQATEHSYPAMVLPNTGSDSNSNTDHLSQSEIDDSHDEIFSDIDEDEDYDSDLLEGSELSLPPGSLPVDFIVGEFNRE